MRKLAQGRVHSRVIDPGQSHVSSMNNLRVASQLQSYPSHIAYVYLELHL